MQEDENADIVKYYKTNENKMEMTLKLIAFQIGYCLFSTSSSAGRSSTPCRLSIFSVNSLEKVDIALAKGKKQYDKRQDIAKKDMRREAERDFKVKNLY